jgi:DNA-binding transcriptional MerR regulator
MKLEDLAEKAGVSPRTVRYYVQRGLLPAPEFRGKDTAYGEEHLHRLRAIKKMQEQFLPLDAIEAALSGKSLPEIEALGVTPTQGAPIKKGPYRVPAAAPPAPRGTVWRRYELAPGLELDVADDADARVRALVEQIIQLAGGSK